MPCQEPRKAWRPVTDGPILFNKPNNGHAYEPIEIPCGTCILCRQETARQWGVRITHEASLYEESCFMTLTYDDEHIPEWGSLRYEDLVKFWKRLRKAHGPMRYYAVGEYGDESLRPHYHACLFGHAFTEKRIILREQPSLLWTTKAVQKLWGLGMVAIGALNFQTAQYTAAYVLKKITKGKQYVRQDYETGELVPLEQPRPFMSKNIGRRWFDKFQQQIQDHDVVIINGRKQKPPKAYDRWTAEGRADFTVSPRGVAWRANTQEIGKRRVEDRKRRRKEQAPEETQEQRHAHARNAHARAKQKSKKV